MQPLDAWPFGGGIAKAIQGEGFRLSKAKDYQASGALISQQVEHHLLAGFGFELLLFQGAAEAAETLLKVAAAAAGIVLERPTTRTSSLQSCRAAEDREGRMVSQSKQRA